MQPLSPELARTFNGRAPQREMTLEQARATVAGLARRLRPLDVVTAPSLEAAQGRVLAEAVSADRDAPPFRRSMRDGYALRAADGAAPRRCVGEIAAGREFSGTLPLGTCVAIMTGAPVPAGADAVVMVEHTRATGSGIELGRPPLAGENIAPMGSDLRAGETIAAAGRRVDSAVLAALASVGCVQPRLYRTPRVAVLSTGDELIPPEEKPAGSFIRDSNGPMLAAMAVHAGAEVVWRRRVPDDRESLAAALREAVRVADVIVTSGGASVGAHDGLGDALHELEAETVFDAVRVRPGRPVRCAAVRDRLVLALPGNPVGAWLEFELLARPALEIWSGLEEPTVRTFPAAMNFPWHRSQPLPLVLFLPVRRAGGGWQEVPYHGSADLAAAAAADGFAMLPENATSLPLGSVLPVLLK